MAKYSVEIIRTSSRTAVFEIEAGNKYIAQELAHEKARNTNFGTKSEGLIEYEDVETIFLSHV